MISHPQSCTPLPQLRFPANKRVLETILFLTEYEMISPFLPKSNSFILNTFGRTVPICGLLTSQENCCHDVAAKSGARPLNNFVVLMPKPVQSAHSLFQLAPHAVEVAAVSGSTDQNGIRLYSMPARKTRLLKFVVVFLYMGVGTT
jgi:hypothetical protein